MPNSDSGPDFRHALVKIGRVTYHGDIEIHRTLLDWIRHQHHTNPRYNNVILHVVLERPSDPTPMTVPSGRSIPLLVLESFLLESIRSVWRKTIPYEQSPACRVIPCHSKNMGVPAEVIQRWLRRQTVERLELKLRRFDERLKELAQVHFLAVHDHRENKSKWHIQGNPDDIPPPYKELTTKQLSRRDFWDQLLYEGIMEGLGYSKNREPFTRLARAVTLREIETQHIACDEETLQAVLLGASGLLPPLRSIEDKASRDFLRHLAKIWKERRKSYSSTILHAADWQLSPTRPSNFPTLRIAAATVLIRAILNADLFRVFIELLKSHEDGDRILHSVRRSLTVTPHPFWTHHYRFSKTTASCTQPLGSRRIDELIANTVVPLALLYARTFRDRSVREGALLLFESMPAASENSVIRLMQKQLLRGKLRVTSASTQQGLLQLYRFYCREERCAECDIGEVVFRGDAMGVSQADEKREDDHPGRVSMSFAASSSPQERERC
jgi:hypothetical protein